MPDRIAKVANRLKVMPTRSPRALIAVAGPPASGKSTFAAQLVAHLNQSTHSAVLVPMDGFHLDNSVLARRGLLARKGAPETFDVDGLVSAMWRLATEQQLYLPSFDRGQDRSVAGRIEVNSMHTLAVIEGNYLLCRDAPWNHLRPLWSMSVFLNEPNHVLFDRLVQRWLDNKHDLREAQARAQNNDMANVAFVRRSLDPSVDLVFGSEVEIQQGA
ncbi:nucleoside/nucleotide kinase family protein [Phaeobacter sp. 22II1-1F12B]|uniref:nucleoside/nucleotide kinase family protein n=1 Tax=Phaeobacter sp. 22II1-1F12B TaxID=1317111 RepID=UPI000B522776|nr:nucleoside/nucleotide kinase family protein [Phaeobacter sp. 22II1-1F12B]